MDRPKIDWEKAKAECHDAGEWLESRHGKEGTPEREKFHADALSYYYGELIRETRKEQKLTQQQLADRVGKERAYIARIEQGKTDLQMSNFVQIINALGLRMQIL
ncbi:Helix-turn-helix [Cruoricaptor ignavus]|uniref:Helix-turn-helix n=1 Tax=Cruoricaptor ignavus TaxID=1118202 RepID=A0A1M6AJM8_9FLAO|nr:helix-turn-helix transcriptional regulator [Cruoricaptor ignavus]QOR72994.1 helix-turn-helix transcriptional regulator [Cruoricaptor ignavus]SHI36607.1 Helix-turn-helix [Cruoricaptor ignavus]